MFMTFRRGLILAAATALIAGTGTAVAASPPSCLTLSANLLQNLQKGDFNAATAHFDSAMKAGLSPQKLQQLWQQLLPQKFGNFERPATPKAVHKGSLNVVITPLEFAHGWANWIVSCGNKGQINGLHFHPGSAPNTATTQAAAGATAWIGEAAVGAKTLPLTIQRKGFVLKGVLDLPAGKGPFGVVDIVPGSGPVNLNGNAGPVQYDMYKKLAAALVKAGWAVVRVAKRGMPPSTGDGNNIVFNDQVADNLAIVEALRENPHINPKRIIVAGHSIGGLIAPKLATETKLAGLILLEAPGENMAKIIMAQVLGAAKASGASTAERQAIAKKQTQFYELAAKAPPGQSVHAAGKTIPANEVALLESWFRQEPLATAHKVKIPVLVVQGGYDFQVPPGNGKALVNAFPNAKLLYIPKMGHDLDIAPCRCAEQMHTGKDAKLAPDLTAGIARWLQSL